MRRARIADVAEAAGVSTATVSLVLNGRSVRVSDETRERVHQAAAHLGYTPNTVARGLRTQLTRTIGLISDEIATTPFAGRMFAGAQDAARENSHLLIMVNTDNDPAVEADAIAALSAQQVDAVIYAAMWHRVVEVPAGLPANSVLLDCRSESGSHPSIVPDEYAGAVLAVQALVDAGHQRIAYVDAAGDDLPAAWLRREAWRDVLLSSGLRIDETLHIADEISSAGGRRAAASDGRVLLQRPHGAGRLHRRPPCGPEHSARSVGGRVRRPAVRCGRTGPPADNRRATPLRDGPLVRRGGARSAHARIGRAPDGLSPRHP
jgi:LacI family transcriptional regulator